jgi:predicted enzyme related to lactoylglutathione lyase
MKHVDTIVLVNDIHQSKEFYSAIMGLEILHDWGNMIVFKERFAIHSANTLLPENEIRRIVHPGKQGQNNVIIYFEAEDLDKEYQRMIDNGVRILHGIVELPWQRIFRVYDPDNHILEIGNPF